MIMTGVPTISNSGNRLVPAAGDEDMVCPYGKFRRGVDPATAAQYLTTEAQKHKTARRPS